MKYALIGYGRMGRAIERQAEARDHARVAMFDRPGTRPSPAALGGAEVAFEFTEGPEAESNIFSALEAGVAVVCGTTDWEPSEGFVDRVERAKAGVVVAPNFSVGVNLFFRLVETAGGLFGELGLHDPYVHEMHHRGKQDAPSGTARQLARILLDCVPGLHSIQEGNPSGRIPEGALHVSSTRSGAEPGTHWVGFESEHDSVVLQHRARSRDGFALGAVLAAEWVHGRRGLHSFGDVLDGLLSRGAREGGESG